MSDDSVDSILRSIQSSKIEDAVSKSYTDVAETLRQSGTPSNNILLSIILSETRRGNDEIMKLTNSLTKLTSSLNTLSNSNERICELLDTQNTILASMSMSNDGSSHHGKGTAGSAENTWYYQGVKLVSRHHVYACIVSQMIGIAQLHLDNNGVRYPDSVDCEFNLLVTSIRVVCSIASNAKGVEYKMPINAKEKGDQGFDSIYPSISSRDSKFPTTMTESNISQIINPITRDVMQIVEYIRQRLCLLECILSPRQIDIIKSISFPFNKGEQLNWNMGSITPRASHPNSQEVGMLSANQKKVYIRERVTGKSVGESLQIASKPKKL